MNTDQNLLQRFVSMEPAGHAFGSIVHVVDALDAERYVLEFFQCHKLAPIIAMGLEYILYYLHLTFTPLFL